MLNKKYENMYLVLPAVDGSRADTKLAVEHTDEAVSEFLKQGYILVGDDDFQKLIGNSDGAYLIADNGTVYLKPAPTDVEVLAESKLVKIAEFKVKRDTEEVQPIEYNGKLYDYDDKSRDRINAAIIALDVSGQSMDWTCADNTSVAVTANDLRGIVACVAVRSNTLHVKYRRLKELVEACEIVEDINNINWE